MFLKPLNWVFFTKNPTAKAAGLLKQKIGNFGADPLPVTFIAASALCKYGKRFYYAFEILSVLPGRRNMGKPAQPCLETEFSEIIFQTIQKKLGQKESKGQGFQEAILPVFQEVLEFSQTIIRELERAGQSPGVACQSGCSYCCHSQVNIIPIEALAICAFIKTDFTAGQIITLNAGISRARSLTAGKTFNQVYAIKDELPCVFLNAGKCSIYTMRPSICRSWNSFDAGACKAAYNSLDAESSVGASQARNFVFGTTRDLFEQLSASLSLQSTTLLLHNAMFDCLNSSDPLGHWADGDDVFRYA